MWTIDAHEAWCPPTLTRSGRPRIRFAWWIIAVEVHRTRRAIVSLRGAVRCGGGVCQERVVTWDALRSAVATGRAPPSNSGAHRPARKETSDPASSSTPFSVHQTMWPSQRTATAPPRAVPQYAVRVPGFGAGRGQVDDGETKGCRDAVDQVCRPPAGGRCHERDGRRIGVDHLQQRGPVVTDHGQMGEATPYQCGRHVLDDVGRAGGGQGSETSGPPCR